MKHSMRPTGRRRRRQNALEMSRRDGRKGSQVKEGERVKKEEKEELGEG